MDNPGIYESYVQAEAWPLLAFLGAVIALPVLGLAIIALFTSATKTRRLQASVALLVSIAVGTLSVAGMIRADTIYRAAEAAKKGAYIAEVQDWLRSNYGAEVEFTDAASLVAGSSRAITTVRGTVQAQIVPHWHDDMIRLVDQDGLDLPPVQ